MIKNVVSVVLDTNTLVSASLNEKSVSRQAFNQAAQKGKVLASGKTLEELKEVLFREKFEKFIPIEERRVFHSDYLELAVVLDVKMELHDCRDPKDNKFLELAVAGNADVIVTGDKDLLVLHPYRGVLIMNSSAFLEWLGEQE